MRRMMAAGRVAVLVATLPLFGCAASFGGYDLAPNGLARGEDELRRALAFDPAPTYRAVIEGERPLPEDDLLRLLYAGIAGRYAGAHEESSRLLDLASYVAEDRVTMSVSKEALSMLTNDRVLPYVPGRTERLMIPYLSALNYLDAGNIDGAAVEARRIEALLDRLDEGVAHDEAPASSRFLHYFAGAVFGAAGDWNAASVAFRRSGSVAEQLGVPWGDGTEARADSLGEVIVLVERGFVPHRVEQSVAVLLPPGQVGMLTDGSVGDKALAATEAAVRILGAASYLYGDRSGYYRDRGFQSDVRLEPWHGDECRDGRWRGTDERCRVPESRRHSARNGHNGQEGHREEEEAPKEDPYLLSIAWPVLYQESAPPATIRVRAGDRAADAIARLDLAGGTRSDFEHRRAALLARTVARAATKLALTEGLEEAAAEKGEAAGRIVGILTNLGTVLTERADTRCWHLLPATVSMVRLRLPAGTHELTLETEQSDALQGGIRIGTVQVQPGTTTFLSTRLWR